MALNLTEPASLAHDASASAETPRRLDRALAWASRALETRCGYALVFALVFALVMVPVLATCLASGKSMVWMVDGLWEQYAWFVYAGQWIRDFMTNPFDPLMWEMNSGFGVDVLQSLAGLFLNPMFLVSALVPPQLAEYAFQAVIVATLYAAGLAFSFWCIRNGAPRRDVFVGALVYTFAGNSLLMFVQPSFLIMLVAFPLLLWGADLLFERRSPALYLGVLTWLFTCSYYDAYMAAVLLVLYCVHKFWFEVRPGLARGAASRALAKLVGVFAGYTAVAFLLSGVMVLPQVMALMGMDRLELEREGALLYSLRWYLEFFAGLSGHVFMGQDSYSGFNALAPVVLVALVLRRRQHRALFVAVTVLTAMMLLPAFGSAMNGFQYAANRWSWGYDLVVALAVVRLVPDLFALEARARRIVIACIAVYGVVFTVLPIPGNTDLFATELVLMAALLGVFFGVRSVDARAYAAVVGCVAVSAAISLSWFLSPWQEGWARQLAGFGKVHAFHTALGVDQLIDQAQEAGAYDPAYRYDRTAVDGAFVYNSNLVSSHMGVSFYNSVYASGVDAFNQSLGLVSTEGINFRYGSLDARAVLDALLGVRYFAAADFDRVLLPYQFQAGAPLASGLLAEGKYTTLYQAEQALPLAFAYTEAVPHDAYDALGMLERQALLLHGVVLADDALQAAALPAVSETPVPPVAAVPFEVVQASGCELLDGGACFVREPGATVTLAFQVPADAEAYFTVLGLRYEDVGLRERYTPDQWMALGFIGRLKAQVEDLFYDGSTAGTVDVWARGSKVSSVRAVNERDHLYGGKEDWAVNLGYFEEGGPVQVALSFANPGVYVFGEVAVQAQPMEGFDEAVAALAANAAHDLVLGRNRIACSVELAQDAALFFSVAYSPGWSAYVDGEPAGVLEANLGFMAVPVGAGAHEVALFYETPYLRAGCLMTLAGVLALAAVFAWRRFCARRGR